MVGVTGDIAGVPTAVSGESGRDALEIVLAVYESSRTGRPVTVGGR